MQNIKVKKEKINFIYKLYQIPDFLNAQAEDEFNYNKFNKFPHKYNQI
jgi:phage terminase small subunit